MTAKTQLPSTFSEVMDVDDARSKLQDLISSKKSFKSGGQTFTGASRPLVSRGSQTVCVVVPLSYRRELTDEERISLRHLSHFLGNYDKYMLVPEGMKIHYAGFQTKPLSKKYFGSPVANDRLMLSHDFYEAFADYKYVLIYHLDALVFSDQLLEWCETDLDYVGPPWIQCEDAPWVKVPRVGNGGFNLRKIESYLRVMDSPRYAVDPIEDWKKFCTGKPSYLRALNLPRKFLKRLRAFNGVRREISRWKTGDEFFWVDRAAHYYPEFKVASVEQGLRFGFEVAPRKCFELNGNQLPFGCHAWTRYDRAFWEPYLLT
jgi:hypothetical protein